MDGESRALKKLKRIKRNMKKEGDDTRKIRRKINKLKRTMEDNENGR